VTLQVSGHFAGNKLLSGLFNAVDEESLQVWLVTCFLQVFWLAQLVAQYAAPIFLLKRLYELIVVCLDLRNILNKRLFDFTTQRTTTSHFYLLI